MLALLDDLSAMSGVQALGTREGEVTRARVGERTLILRLEAITVSSDNYKWFAATIKTDPRRQLPTGAVFGGKESLIFA